VAVDDLDPPPALATEIVAMEIESCGCHEAVPGLCGRRHERTRVTAPGARGRSQTRSRRSCREAPGGAVSRACTSPVRGACRHSERKPSTDRCDEFTRGLGSHARWCRARRCGGLDADGGIAVPSPRASAASRIRALSSPAMSTAAASTSRTHDGIGAAACHGGDAAGARPRRSSSLTPRA